MANYQIKFTTTKANEDILQNAQIKSVIMERLGFTTDAQYDAKINDSGIEIKFDIIFNGTNKISFNDRIYNDLIEDMAYSSGSYLFLKALKIQNAGTGILIFNIR